MHHHVIAKITRSVPLLMERVCVRLAFRAAVVKSLVLMERMAKTVNLSVSAKMAPNAIQKLANVFVVRAGKGSSVIGPVTKNVSEQIAMKRATVSIVARVILKLVRFTVII